MCEVGVDGACGRRLIFSFAFVQRKTVSFLILFRGLGLGVAEGSEVPPCQSFFIFLLRTKSILFNVGYRRWL